MSLEAYAMKKRDEGVLIVGFNDPSRLFDDLTDRLNSFYESKDLFFAAQVDKQKADDNRIIKVQTSFSHLKSRYKHTVHSSFPDYDSHGDLLSKPDFYGFLNITYFGVNHNVEFVKTWDFPHRPFVQKEYFFGVFFDLADKGLRKDDRDSFIRFLK